MSGVNSNIPTYYVEQFSNILQELVQQRGSRLRQTVTTGMHVGSQASPVDQVGAVAAKKVTGRYSKIEPINAPADRRWVFPQAWSLPQYVDQFDELQMLLDPKAKLAQNAQFAMGRAQDAEILTAVFGTSKTGNNGGTSTSFPSDQVVSVKEGAASSTNLTVEKLIKAKEILLGNDVDLDNDQLYCPITAKNHSSLLRDIRVTSKDYNDEPVLVNGRIQHFLGIDFIHTELLDTGTDDQSGTSTAVPLYAKSGLYLGMWKDITTTVSIRHDMEGEPFQIYVYGMFGATRTEEKKVVKIWAH